jgi:recombinational DNA repair protein (RecF pathway)
MSAIPNKTFTINLQSNSYTTKITQGKIIDLELNKVTFSNGFYNSIPDGSVLDSIDYMSALYAFYPEVKKDAKIDIRELEPEQMKEISTEMKKFYKWYFDWKKFMNEPEKEEEIKEEI